MMCELPTVPNPTTSADYCTRPGTLADLRCPVCRTAHLIAVCDQHRAGHCGRPMEPNA